MIYSSNTSLGLHNSDGHSSSVQWVINIKMSLAFVDDNGIVQLFIKLETSTVSFRV